MLAQESPLLVSRSAGDSTRQCLTSLFAVRSTTATPPRSSMSRLISSTVAVTAALSSAALLAPIADAHQIVLLPEPIWTTNDKDTKYNPLAFLENQGFSTQEDFTAWRTENGYKSLRDFMDSAKYTVTDGADSACGFTDPNGTPQPIPEGNALRSTGYTHDGPCEVWIDDTMVMDGDNCHEKFPGKDHTVDYSACKGACTLRWYWLGVRFLKNAYSWQVYKACIPLSGSGGGAPETSGSVATPESTPAPESRSTGSWGTTATTTPPQTTDTQGWGSNNNQWNNQWNLRG